MCYKLTNQTNLATRYKLDYSSTVISFLGAYSTYVCKYCFLLSMRFCLEKLHTKSKKKTSFFEKLNQTHSILLQFTQDLHLLTAYHQTNTLISRFFLLMPPLLRNGSFLFILQSHQAQLVPVTTISTREAP